jgi:hypothetical protein
MGALSLELPAAGSMVGMRMAILSRREGSPVGFIRLLSRLKPSPNKCGIYITPGANDNKERRPRQF